MSQENNNVVLENMNRLYMFILTLSLTLSSPLWASEKLSLEKFLQRTKIQNLDLKIDQASSDAQNANAKGISLSPPMLAAGRMQEETGASSTNIEISQEIPFPTKTSGDLKARNNEAKAQEQIRLGREKEILALAKFYYIDLWSAEKRIELLSQKKTIFENHIKLAKSSARSDSFASVHVLKTESDLDLLENELLEAKQILEEKQARIAVFLNENPSSFKMITEEPPLSPFPKIDPKDSTHQLQAVNYMLESLKGKELEANSQWLPDLTFKYRKAGPTSMAGASNEYMVGITLPFIFFWEPNRASQKAAALRLQGEFELEKQRRTIEADKVSLLSKLESLKAQLEILNAKLIPRAERRMKLVHNLAPRDLETLQDHRDTMEAFPELKLKALALRVTYEQAVAEIERYSTNKE